MAPTRRNRSGFRYAASGPPQAGSRKCRRPPLSVRQEPAAGSVRPTGIGQQPRAGSRQGLVFETKSKSAGGRHPGAEYIVPGRTWDARGIWRTASIGRLSDGPTSKRKLGDGLPTPNVRPPPRRCAFKSPGSMAIQEGPARKAQPVLSAGDGGSEGSRHHPGEDFPRAT